MDRRRSGERREPATELSKVLFWGEVLANFATLVAALSLLGALLRQAGRQEATFMGFFVLLFSLFSMAFRAGRYVLESWRKD